MLFFSKFAPNYQKKACITLLFSLNLAHRTRKFSSELVGFYETHKATLFDETRPSQNFLLNWNLCQNLITNGLAPFDETDSYNKKLLYCLQTGEVHQLPGIAKSPTSHLLADFSIVTS